MQQHDGLKPDVEPESQVVRDAVPTQVPNSAPSLQEQQLAVRQWLQPTDYLSPSSEFMKHLHSHVPGTCSWLHESPSFKTWTTPGKTNCLAIRGVAGSGKSVLAASTVRQLQEAEPDVPVLFFFFRQIVENNHSARYLIRDFASQLLPHSQPLVSNLRVLGESYGVEGNEHNRLWGALVDSIDRMEKVYLVVDALDEMDERDFAIIDHLVKLGNRRNSTTKLLVTSRPIPRIEETLRVLRVPHVKLDPTLTHPDVARYVTISMCALDPVITPEKEIIVRQAICERAQGLFLHARLMVDALIEGLKSGRITEETFPDSLDRLPYNLKDVYEEMLKEHSRRSGVSAEQQARILMCVTQAKRPLRLIELGSLVARMRKFEDLSDGKALVRASCGTLLEILEDENVSVIHHSFTEFLHDETRASRPGSFPVIDDVTAHAMLAVFSLQYLDSCPLLDTTRDNPSNESQEAVGGQDGVMNISPIRSVSKPTDECSSYDDPNWLRKELQRRQQAIQDLALVHHLLRYAITNLSHHISKAGDGHPDVVSALDTFLVPGKPAFGLWVYSNWKSYLCSTLNVVHLASFENWPAIVEHLSAKYPMFIDAPDGSGRGPISYAAEKGHAQIVRFLLEQGASPNADDRIGLTPMHYAASNGHADVARLLIDAGISPLIQKTKNTPNYQQLEPDKGKTALQYAFTGCHNTVISLFLPLIPSLEIDRCLHWAHHAEHLEMVLKTGNANVDSFCRGETKLFKAAARHDLEAMQLLLRYGADPNRRCGIERRYDAGGGKMARTFDFSKGPTAIHALAGYDDIDSLFCDEMIERARQCLETLMSYGAQIDARADEATGWSKDFDLTPLHYAVRKRDVVDARNYWLGDNTPEIMARLLLEAGADPNARSKLGRNCIHFANPELPDLIDVLINGGADINATDFNGYSPLLAMISPQGRRDTKPDVPAFERLIRNGADIGLSSNMGDTVLHMIFMSLNKFKENDIPFLLSLISSSDDFNRRNNKGLVPLLEYKLPERNDYEKRNRDDEKILQAMIQKGMDINASDCLGETILWKIARSRGASLDTIQQFIRLGANPGSRKADGCTLLYLAVRNQLGIDWIRYLVTSGADPTLQDDEGRTLIHVAAEACISQPRDGMRLIHALAELGVSPTKAMISGQTILHFVSSYGKTGLDRGNWIDRILEEPMFGLSGPNISDVYGVTPLHHAAAYASEFTTGKLLQLGADPASLTTEDLSPLHIACIARKPNIVGVLLSYYAERGLLNEFVNQAHSSGSRRSSLHYACRSGCLESVRYLLSHGADPSRRDGNNRTSIHALAELPLEKKLWKEASPVKKRDLPGVDGEWRPTDLSWSSSHIRDRTASILGLLVEAGADLEARAVDKDGLSVTAMDLALVYDSKVLARELSRRGVVIPPGTEIQLPNNEDVRNAARALLSITDSRKLIETIEEKLSEGDYEIIEEFARLGGDMKVPGSFDRTGLHILVAGGYSDLLERSFKSDASQFESRAETEEKSDLRGLLAEACDCKVPNLHVIKVLIEAIGLEVDGIFRVRGRTYTTARKSPIHILASGGHFWQIEALKYVLSRGVNASALDASGQTALLHAISSKSPSGFWKEATVRILLDHGSSPNEREVKADGSGQSCLEISDDVRITQLLLEYGADVLQSPGALHNAITGRMDQAMVVYLLKMGADPNALFQNRYPLHSAACAENVQYAVDWDARRKEVIEALLRHGADRFRLYDDGRHVLQACIEEHGVTSSLLESDSLDLQKRGKNERTALISACIPYRIECRWIWRKESMQSVPHTEAALTLLKCGAAVDIFDDTGRSALHWLCTFKDEPFGSTHMDLLAALLAAQPSLIHVADKTGQKPLHLALQSDQTAVVQHLIEKGADPADPDPDGNIALHHYARRMIGEKTAAIEAVRVFKSLLAMGLEINTRNHRGETPLQVYMSTGWDVKNHVLGHDDDEIWKIFKDSNADWRTTDDQGLGLLHAVAARKVECKWDSTQTRDIERTFKKLIEDMSLDPRQEDAQLRTPIDLAVVRGHDGILSLFSDKGKHADDTQGRSRRWKKIRLQD
ncbi:ankyrin repeat-containing domain protein [Xylaria longipes]|nr:ankyrin repeat-containing domain protein [Xylaria longipes]